ncbi:hypothetical protein RUM43_005220 [Polyplax serrata]|uniref:Nucleoporin NSP1-like C-terminal domain-containing protein n=1 Tax=Polyplax serrata TaxID=468196 RepID=A0AAN8SBS4_POLSC
MNFSFQKNGDTSSLSAQPAGSLLTTSMPQPTLNINTSTTTAQTVSSISTSTATVTSCSNSASGKVLPLINTGAKTGVTSAVTFAQLEENINKWTIELEEQEKVFMNQVAHINEWDRLLLANGDKIVSLNYSVENVKLEQQQLDHELDFIVAQQRELEECLLPLEKELADVTVSDPERDTTYRMAESLKSQLRQMSEELKEVIEHINEKNKNQDTGDPVSCP